MSRAHLAPAALRDPRLVRMALATLQPAAGIVALLCCSTALGAVAGTPGGRSAGWPLPVAIAVGVGLCVVWALARRRRPWLIALAVAAGAFAVGMILITVLAGRAARFDPHRGLWTGTWLGAVAVLLWASITVAAVLELRLVRKRSGEDPFGDTDQPVWAAGVAVAAPLALIVVVGVVLTTAAPTWMIRANSRITRTAPVVRTEPSELSGSVRWTTESYAEQHSVVTTAGLAVPVVADRHHNAGVVMIDPVSGKINWRYELRGIDRAPELSPTAQGRGIAVTFDESDLPDEVPYRIFTLDAATGKITAFWPTDLVGTDPPVVFRHVVHGTNSVSALAANGRKLWTFKPEHCADPRDAASTPSMILVPALRCDGPAGHPAYELHGLDPRTGDQRWTRSWDSESAPTQAVVRRDFQVELNGTSMLRRDLRTGAIAWAAEVPCDQTDGTSASRRTIFVASCPGDPRHSSVAAYDLRTGRRLWARGVHGRQLTSISAVDDRHVVALTVAWSGRHASCRAELLDRGTSRPLQSFPQDTRSVDRLAQYRAGLVECQESSVYRLAGSVVLQIELATPPTGNLEAERFRFIGLS